MESFSLFNSLPLTQMNVTALNLSASENEQPTVGKMGQTVKAQDSWAAITGKIAGGDRDSFASYYEAFFDVMYATVKRSTGCDESTCLDIVQDAMLKAVRKMKALDSHEHTLAWTLPKQRLTIFFARDKDKTKCLQLWTVSKPTLRMWNRRSMHWRGWLGLKSS